MINPIRILGRQRAIRRATHLLRPGSAVILDTETTDFAGDIIEVALIEADTGAVLLNTLVHPERPISPEAQTIHGINADMCATAPAWAQVWPQLHAAIAGRIVLAYNAPYDHAAVTRRCRQTAVAPHQWRWGCLMRLDAQARGTRRWRRLDGGHRALGDVQAARRRLLSIAAGEPA